MLLNWGVGEDSWESLGLQGDPTIHPKGNQSWILIGRTDAEAETPILWPADVKKWLIERPWCWERLKARGEGDRGWDGWMSSLTQWTWVWVNSGSWWWTGRPGVLQSMGSLRVRHDWVTELNCVFSFLLLMKASISSYVYCLKNNKRQNQKIVKLSWKPLKKWEDISCKSIRI